MSLEMHFGRIEVLLGIPYMFDGGLGLCPLTMIKLLAIFLEIIWKVQLHCPGIGKNSGYWVTVSVSAICGANDAT